VDTNIELATE